MIKGVKRSMRYITSRADRVESLVVLLKLDTGYEVHWNKESEAPTILAHACMFVDSIATALGRSPDNVVAMISQGLHHIEVEEQDDEEID